MTRLYEHKLLLAAATLNSEETRIASQISSLIAAINRSVGQSKLSISELEKHILPDASNETRMRRNIHAALIRRFTDQLKRFQELQDALVTENKQRATRNILLCAPSLSERHAASLADRGISAHLVMAQKLQSNDPALVENLHKVSSELQDAKNLESAMSGLRQMFVELAAQIDAQGQMLDSIEHGVINTKNFASKSKYAISRASFKQRRGLRRSLICTMICLLVLIMIAIPLVEKLWPQIQWQS